MFYFMVKHFHWLSRIPGFPHLFDAMLLTWTCIAHRERLHAMETLEVKALHMEGMSLRIHRFGGMEFVSNNGRELGHLHGHGLLDVILGKEKGSTLIAEGKVRPHHVFPTSHWVSFQLESQADVPFALNLLDLAQAKMRLSH
jgi:hypothetical protein